jgi:hypothetical protein
MTQLDPQEQAHGDDMILDNDDQVNEGEEYEEEEYEDEEEDDDGESFYAKWMIDGCATLNDTALRCMELANEFKRWHHEGWRLGSDVCCGHGVMYRETELASTAPMSPMVEGPDPTPEELASPLVPEPMPNPDPSAEEEENHCCDPIIRAKWQLDGCNSLLECADAWKDMAATCRLYKAQGWELREEISNDFGFLARVA